MFPRRDNAYCSCNTIYINKTMKTEDCLLVSISNDILVVGRKTKGQFPEIINAFQGEEAKELYKYYDKGRNNGT